MTSPSESDIRFAETTVKTIEAIRGSMEFILSSLENVRKILDMQKAQIADINKRIDRITEFVPSIE